MSSLALLVLVLGSLFLAVGIRIRRRRGGPIDRAFASKRTYLSFMASSMIVGIAFPAVWMIVARSIYGGSIEASLPPGFGVDALLGMLVFGVVMGLINTFYGFVEHLDSKEPSSPGAPEP